MDARRLLEVYIYDYLFKRNLVNSARLFSLEAGLPSNLTVIDAPNGFLWEWWSIFWEKYNGMLPHPPPPNQEASIINANAQQHQPCMNYGQQMQQQQMQMQFLLHQHQRQEGQYLQQHQLHQLRHQQSTARSNLSNQTVAAHSMNREDLQRQKAGSSGVETERYMQTSVKNTAPLFPKPTDSSSSRPAVGGDRPNELLIPNVPARNFKSSYGVRDGKGVLLGAEGLKYSMTPPPNSTALGSNLDVDSSFLKGWPLVGPDQHQPGASSHQITLPHLNHQSQLHLRQQIRGLLSGHSIDTGRDMIGNDMSNVPVGLSSSSHGNAWTSQPQRINHSEQQYMQPPSLEQLAPNSNYQSPLPQTKAAVGNVVRDATWLNILEDHDQTSKDQTSKKRKQPMPSGGPSSTSRTAYVITPSNIPGPSTHTSDDISLPALPPDYNSSKAELENAVAKVSLEGGVGSFLSSDNPETGMEAAGLLDAIQDVAFLEIAALYANGAKCCALSLDGKVIATGGDDRKAILWSTELRQQKCELEHFGSVTDLCFGPGLPRLATSSLDKTVKIWSVDGSCSPLRTFAAHNAPVLSVDFHPTKEDLVCSCDDANSIRYWSIEDNGCSGNQMGSATQVRFEPTSGKYLAASIENGVCIIDVETMQTYRFPLKCHEAAVRSVCWSSSGGYLASMSEDTLRVWKIGSWGLEESVFELKVSDKKLRCCGFHPRDSSLIAIGSSETLELWHMAENKMMSAIKQPTRSLAVPKAAGMVASVSDNSVVKVWK